MTILKKKSKSSYNISDLEADCFSSTENSRKSFLSDNIKTKNEMKNSYLFSSEKSATSVTNLVFKSVSYDKYDEITNLPIRECNKNKDLKNTSISTLFNTDYNGEKIIKNKTLNLRRKSSRHSMDNSFIRENEIYGNNGNINNNGNDGNRSEFELEKPLIEENRNWIHGESTGKFTYVKKTVLANDGFRKSNC